ncbi:MAG: nucleotidyltransferase family protein, partial [Bryobacteraceae bacterium]
MTPWLRAILASLRFDKPAPLALDGEDLDRALTFCDEQQLTLRLPLEGPAIERRLEANRERHRRLRAIFAEIEEAFTAARIPFVVLKGFTHYPGFVGELERRAQYDLDLFSPPGSVEKARDGLLALGYEPVRGRERYPTDHLPVMLRRNAFQWRGDYFDVDIPFAVELHFRFWDERTEGFHAPGANEFWERREGMRLHPADRLGYAALHVLRHLLRGSLKAGHVYELAWFLDHQRDKFFWSEWRALHGGELRRLESIAFRLAACWFGCASPGDAGPEAERWMERYALAPLESHSKPNKHEIWLHLPLVPSTAAKLRVLRRRLLPATLPARSTAARLLHHARAAPAVAWHGLA